MSHKRISAIFALALLILIQTTGGVFRFLCSALFIYAVALLSYNYVYLKKHGMFTSWSLVRILFFSASIVSLYFIVPEGFLRALFLIAAAGIFYVIELNLKVFSEQIVFLETLLAYFGLSLGIFAFSFYFLPNITSTLLALSVVTYFVSRASLDYIPQSSREKNFYSLLITLAQLEIGWGLLLLPLHFTALALVLFNCFYVLWIIVYHHLFKNLTSKKISFHITFSAIIILIIFLSTPWK